MKRLFTLAIIALVILAIATACADDSGNGGNDGGNGLGNGGNGINEPGYTQDHINESGPAPGYNEGGDHMLMGEEHGSELNMMHLDWANLDGTIYERVLDSPTVLLQLQPLTPGEELMTLHTNHGDITLRFFPEEAPLAVENFKTLARDGFYDGLIFHRIFDGFMIQGGCPMGTGMGGDSIYPGGLGLERSFNLFHFRGALATAHAGRGRTIGSQFYIVQNSRIAPRTMANLDFPATLQMQDEIIGEFSDGRHILVRDIKPAELINHFIRYGGTPHLDWFWNVSQDRFTGEPYTYGHTVFGHVVSGMDVVDAIAAAPADPDGRPDESIIIESISFEIYGE